MAGFDAAAILAQVGADQPQAEADPNLAALAEALAYPLRMGTGTTTPEAAAQLQAETGLPAGMLNGLLSWGMQRAAQGLSDAPNEEAWQYVSQLVTAMAAVKQWAPADVADGIFEVMTEGTAGIPRLYGIAADPKFMAEPADDVDQAADLAPDPEPDYSAIEPEPEPAEIGE